MIVSYFIILSVYSLIFISSKSIIPSVFPAINNNFFYLLIFLSAIVSLIIPIENKTVKKFSLSIPLYTLLYFNLFLILNFAYLEFIMNHFNGTTFIAIMIIFYTIFGIIIISKVLDSFIFISEKTGVANLFLIIGNIFLMVLGYQIINKKIQIYYIYLLILIIFFLTFLTMRYLILKRKGFIIPASWSGLILISLLSIFLMQKNLSPIYNKNDKLFNKESLKPPFAIDMDKIKNIAKNFIQNRILPLILTGTEPFKKQKIDKKKAKHVLLITTEATTPYHLELFGYKRKTMPNLSKFSKEALFFTKAFSQGPNTRPAISSLMTSKYGNEIYWTDTKRFIPIKLNNLTFAEIMKKNGYKTHAVVTHSYFLPRFQYNQGFDNWDTDLISIKDKIAFTQETSKPIFKKFKNIVNNNSKNDPMFIWLHFFDSHDYYIFRDDAPNFGSKPEDLYDNELYHTDIYLGKIIKFLKDKGVYDDYVIVITGDHGEAFGKHGYKLHGRSLYNDQIWVPLMMRFPGIKPQMVEMEVGHIDIIPTILDYLGINKYSNLLSGKSVFSKMESGISEPIYSVLMRKGKEDYAMIYNGYKLIYYTKQNIKQLYDIRNDPNEEKDISVEHPEILYPLWRKMSVWVKSQKLIFKKLNGN